MQVIDDPTPEAAILARLVIGSEDTTLPPAVAEAILSLRFGDADKDEMSQLSKKARAGRLTRKEQAQVEAYSRIGSLLGILKSQARRALKRVRQTNGKTGQAKD